MTKYKIILAFFLLSITLTAQERYELPCRTDLFYRSMELIRSQVGVVETGHNRGEVLKYVKPFGKSLEGQPYCAMGQYWGFWQGCNDLLLPYSEIPIAKNPLAYGIFIDAKKRGIETQYKAFIGDLIDWKFSNSTSGHIERVDSIAYGGNVWTIGFNTTARKKGDQRDGGGVHRVKRNIYSPIGRMQIKGLIGFKLYGKC